ncbi:MAG: PTS sugar transporter subunit IIA, partial [Propionibacteriales bacterium]|nr:PTS sugar transporter subunit IIA [Propionibacteriales bacterium]
MSELITADLVALDAQFGNTKDDVIKALAQLVANAGRSDNAAGLADDAFAREAKSSTGMPGGLAIPHCRSEHVSESTLVFARLAPGIDFGSKDGAADLVFLIAAPAAGDQEHMRLLTKLARALVRKDFTDALRSATSNDEVVRLVSEVVSDQPAATTDPATVTTTAPGQNAGESGATGATTAAPATAASTPTPETAAQPAASPSSGDMTIVAVTACPTGIAHTYMAAEALEAAGRKAGVNLVVEPQGSVGAETIDPSVISSASAVIFATDVGVRSRERFAGLPEISTGVKQGIHEADALVARAITAANDPNAQRVSGEASSAQSPGAAGRPAMAGGLGTKLRTALLTGVSYMIPFVAAGGLLIALGFLLGGYEVALGFTGIDKTTGQPFADGNLTDYV